VQKSIISHQNQRGAGEAVRAAGAAKVYRETASGAKTERAQLRRVLAQLDASDVLMVTRLDRLARSTRDLLDTLATVERFHRTCGGSVHSYKEHIRCDRPANLDNEHDQRVPVRLGC
jgi:hypothetical protein